MGERVMFLGMSDGGVDGEPRVWIPWHVPPEATFVHISALGAGSAGIGETWKNSSLYSADFAFAGCGGGESTLVIPAIMLPPRLWLSPGRKNCWTSVYRSSSAESSIVALSPTTTTAILTGPGANSAIISGAVAADARSGLAALPGRSVAGDSRAATQTWARAGVSMGGTDSGYISAGTPVAAGGIAAAGNLPSVPGGTAGTFSSPTVVSTPGLSALPIEQSGTFVPIRRGGTGGGAHWSLQGYFGNQLPAEDRIRGGDGAPGCGGGGGGVMVIDDIAPYGQRTHYSRGGDGGPGMIQIWWE